jgi:hypothetical protein
VLLLLPLLLLLLHLSLSMHGPWLSALLQKVPPTQVSRS